MTFFGLALIAIGTGGIKPCVSAFGGDQFRLPEQERQLQTFFSVFYFSINAGSFISTIVTPILRCEEASSVLVVDIFTLCNNYVHPQGGRGVFRRHDLLLPGLRRAGRPDGRGHRDHHRGEAALQDEPAPGKHRVQGASQYGDLILHFRLDKDKDKYSTPALPAHGQHLCVVLTHAMQP